MKPPAFSKGLLGFVQRTALLPTRYGIASGRLESHLREMIHHVSRWGFEPTIPVTAIILERHAQSASALEGADVAIHGYRHLPYDELSPDAQVADLVSARDTLSRAGFEARGFRAPYLRQGKETNQILRNCGLVFDSSDCCFTLTAGHELYDRCLAPAMSRYPDLEISPSLPATEDGLIEMPVCLPDDEILIDGLAIRNPETLDRVYQAMLEDASAAGSHLVLQIHPERFPLCKAPLTHVLERARDSGAWLASLTEVANWIVRNRSQEHTWPRGRPFAVSVTGDLDAVSLTDFASRLAGG